MHNNTIELTGYLMEFFTKNILQFLINGISAIDIG